MNPELWRKVEECFHAALEYSPETRTAFLDKVCGGEADLRWQVELLLAREEQAGTFLETSAFQDLGVAFPLSNCEFGSYRIVSALGAGGMGEVYRAHDSKLDRDVAVKILPLEFAHDPERLARLRREARTLASLNHPNIAVIYGLEQLGEADCLVLELVEGETLRGPVPLDKALDYALQVAEALHAAHEKSIIHRDLKPDNVKITPQGRVKVLDFGLAKPMSELESAQAAECGPNKRGTSAIQPPRGESVMREFLKGHQEVSYPKDGQATLTLTRGGIGTPGYMSPEQARGTAAGVVIDKRTDIWSFGCLLYELLTGKRAFSGDTAEERLAAVLEREPDWNALPANTPSSVRKLLRCCLQKDVAQRLDNIGAVRQVLEASAAQERGFRRWRAPVAAAITLAAITSGAIWMRMSSQIALPDQPIPLTTYFGDEDFPDFSPDGNQVVFSWNGEHGEVDHLFTKIVRSENYRQLTKGNLEEFSPKWSPDGRWIAFQRRTPRTNDIPGSEYTFLISATGGNERKIREGHCSGLSWSSNSSALVCAAESGLTLTSIENGGMRQLTSVKKGELDEYPAFSPNGRRLLFIHGKELAGCDLYVLELNADLSPRGEPRRVTTTHASPYAVADVAWTGDGHDAIWAISRNMPYVLTLNRVSVTGDGPLELLPFGRDVYGPTVARHRLAYVHRSRDIDIWRTDGRTPQRHPVSSTEVDLSPQFSPDGKRIAFESDRSGPEEIWVANADGSEPLQVTHFGRYCGSPHWSPDGRWIAFDVFMESGVWDIWAVESKGGNPRRLTSGPGSSNVPSFSRDGKWVYFGSTRTGRPEVFRVPFAGGTAVQTTRSGGAAPLESVNGRLIYFTKNNGLYESTIAGDEERPLGIVVFRNTFDVTANGIYFIALADKTGKRREIRFYDFATRQSRLIQAFENVNTFKGLSVSPDGKTFLYSVWEDRGHELMLVENFH